MRLKSFAAAAVLLAVSGTTARAQITQLTFEGLGDNQVIGSYYNGGAGGNLGVTFGSNATALISNEVGGSGNIQGQPSGVTIMYLPTATNAFMNVAAGFNTGFSLFYSAVYQAGSVSVYDGFGGTGTLLGTRALPVTPSQPGTPACPGTQTFCPFQEVSIAFEGTGKSVVFGGVANQIGFDNVTFGSTRAATAVTSTPEPASLVLIGTGLLGVFGVARRRRNTA